MTLRRNASVKYTPGEGMARSEGGKRAGWEFFFLGAELANFDDAERIGITSDRRSRVSKAGMGANFCTMSENVKDYMRDGRVSADRADKLEKGDDADDA